MKVLVADKIARNLETGDDQWLAYPVQRDDQESRATRDLMPGSAFTADSSALITSFEGKIWRVGLMGENSRPEVVKLFLGAFRHVLGDAGYAPARS